MTYHPGKQWPLLHSKWSAAVIVTKCSTNIYPCSLPPPPLTFRFLLMDAECEPHLPPPSSAGFLS